MIAGTLTDGVTTYKLVPVNQAPDRRATIYKIRGTISALRALAPDGETELILDECAAALMHRWETMG